MSDTQLLEDTVGFLRDSEAQGLLPNAVTMVGASLQPSGGFNVVFRNVESHAEIVLRVPERLVSQFLSDRHISPNPSAGGRASVLATNIEEELFACEWNESSEVSL